jgi:hypothetical protein
MIGLREDPKTMEIECAWARGMTTAFCSSRRDARVPLEGFREGDCMNTGRMTLIGIGLALYLLGFGMLAGATVERMRFDHKRSQILARYDEALREWHAFRIELEKTVARP